MKEKTYIPAVVGYLVCEDKVLLIERKRVSLGLGKGLISGIGGKIGDSQENIGETKEQALARELMEEIGVTPGTGVKFTSSNSHFRLS